MSNIVPARDIETVTAEINIITVQTQRGLLTGAIEIGRRLVEAKSMVPQGEWGKYLQERVNYSQSSANNLMKLYREYGDNQASLFNDFANSQTFQNLTYTKALAMLALPADLRQSFVEEHDVENMSTREVQSAVQEELEAVKAKNSELEQALAQEKGATRSAEAKAEELAGQLKRAQSEKTHAEYEEKKAKNQVEKLQKDLAKAEIREKEAKADLERAKENPDIPESMMEQLRGEVAADAAAKATVELKKQLEAATESADTATKARQVAEKQIADLQKQLQVSSPDMVRLGTYLEAMQEAFSKILDVLKDIQAEDPDTAAKLRANTKAKVLEQMIQDLEDSNSGAGT